MYVIMDGGRRERNLPWGAVQRRKKKMAPILDATRQEKKREKTFPVAYETKGCPRDYSRSSSSRKGEKSIAFEFRWKKKGSYLWIGRERGERVAVVLTRAAFSRLQKRGTARGKKKKRERPSRPLRRGRKGRTRCSARPVHQKTIFTTDLFARLAAQKKEGERHRARHTSGTPRKEEKGKVGSPGQYRGRKGEREDGARRLCHSG